MIPNNNQGMSNANSGNSNDNHANAGMSNFNHNNSMRLHIKHNGATNAPGNYRFNGAQRMNMGTRAVVNNTYGVHNTIHNDANMTGDYQSSQNHDQKQAGLNGMNNNSDVNRSNGMSNDDFSQLLKESAGIQVNDNQYNNIVYDENNPNPLDMMPDLNQNAGLQADRNENNENKADDLFKLLKNQKEPDVSISDNPISNYKPYDEAGEAFYNSNVNDSAIGSSEVSNDAMSDGNDSDAYSDLYTAGGSNDKLMVDSSQGDRNKRRSHARHKSRKHISNSLRNNSDLPLAVDNAKNEDNKSIWVVFGEFICSLCNFIIAGLVIGAVYGFIKQVFYYMTKNDPYTISYDSNEILQKLLNDVYPNIKENGMLFIFCSCAVLIVFAFKNMIRGIMYRKFEFFVKIGYSLIVFVLAITSLYPIYRNVQLDADNQIKLIRTDLSQQEIITDTAYYKDSKKTGRKSSTYDDGAIVTSSHGSINVKHNSNLESRIHEIQNYEASNSIIVKFYKNTKIVVSVEKNNGSNENNAKQPDSNNTQSSDNNANNESSDGTTDNKTTDNSSNADF